jgi:phosphoglycerate dehydrogenase-like enzyme
MPELQIYCDAHLGDKATRLLREGVGSHRLILPEQRGKSVLSVAPADSSIFQADIALGQPDVESVLKSERLRWLQITSAGFTRYDTAEFRVAAKARGLVVTNSSSVYAEACAEHVFAFMLAQARQLPLALKSRCAGGTVPWNELRNNSRCLQGQEVVILGFGTIASRLIEMLAPFQMKITAMRRTPKGDEGVATTTPENLTTALSTADHMVNILPENGDSRHFVSTARLNEMKPGVIFYNIGRGATVDQPALAAALHSGHMGAAWLDVTDPEPLPDNHVLLTAPNCFITPHTAGGHQNESETLVRHFLENLQRFDQVAPLRDRIM